MHCRAYFLLERDFQELKENDFKVMLSNPVLENPVNLEAARMLIKDESLYKQIVLRLFSQPIQLLEDPNFIGEYYKQKKVELKHTKEWNLKYAAAVAGLARESRRLSKANYPTERNQLCPTPISVCPESRYGVAGSSAWHPISYDQVEIFADTQTEMDSVMKTGRTKERWKSVALPDGGNESESWEEEVEDLVTWTNTLNTNILED
ncbi:ubiquitin-conjugating enzyme E2 U isoform X33 [Canis lupus familiaris]|uniref:ubiquitin-conjugating enzyme E2 U isoform X33 n=1 Tax=Canis lupus familiaris TaxID=9615 RepID=UPI0018F46F9F|nr:ubiquitin-conjugating enzyme E2 U isoform X33 [Canis lupus familiaris]